MSADHLSPGGLPMDTVVIAMISHAPFNVGGCDFLHFIADILVISKLKIMAQTASAAKTNTVVVVKPTPKAETDLMSYVTLR